MLNFAGKGKEKHKNRIALCPKTMKLVKCCPVKQIILKILLQLFKQITTPPSKRLNRYRHQQQRRLLLLPIMRLQLIGLLLVLLLQIKYQKWAPPSEFVSSSISSWQILTAHAQPFRGARDLAFCLKVSLDSLLVWASSEGSGETARMRRLAWTFAARIGDKYQIRLSRFK